eukprot:3353083-Pyramimonas_sp.AAC.1
MLANPEGILRKPSESEGILRNPTESSVNPKGILRNASESEGTLRKPQESHRILRESQCNPKEPLRRPHAVPVR